MFDPRIERKYPYLSGYLRFLTRKNWVPPRINWGAVLGAIGGIVLVAGMFSLNVTTMGAGGFAALVGIYFGIRNRSRAVPQMADDPRIAYAREVAHLMVGLTNLKRLHRDMDEGSLLMMEEAARGWTRVQSALDSGAWIDPYRTNSLAGLRDRIRHAAESGMADILAMYRPYLPQEVQPRGWTDYASELVEAVLPSAKTSSASIPGIFWDANTVADKLSRLAEEAERISLHGDPQAMPIPCQSIDHVLGEIKVRAVAETELDSQQIKLN